MLNYEITKCNNNNINIEVLVAVFTVLFFGISGIRFMSAMIYYIFYYARTNHISYDNIQI